MDPKTLKALESALALTPGNLILKQQIARGYFSLGHFEKARFYLKQVVQEEPSGELTLMLAQTYLGLKQYSPALLICEELLESTNSPEVFSTYLQLLIETEQLEEAVNQYHAFQQILPGWEDDKLEIQLKEPTFEFENLPANEFLEKPVIDFSRVGGMEEVKHEIRMKIIEPVNNPAIFKAYGKKAGGGILMYGPPGCGKTHLAKATAGEIKAPFLSVGIEEILDMWVGNSEKNLYEKFELARQHSPCVLFFDEIDALGSKRSDLRQSASRNVINLFLNELDGMDNDNEGLLILGATNTPWHMDSAFLRPGRFDRIIFVPPPDMEARAKILQIHMEGKPVKDISYEKLAMKTEGFSGADLQLLIDYAVEEKLALSMKSGQIVKLSTKDLLRFVSKIKPSSLDWFNTAKSYVLYGNSSGRYDEVKAYLNL